MLGAPRPKPVQAPGYLSPTALSVLGSHPFHIAFPQHMLHDPAQIADVIYVRPLAVVAPRQAHLTCSVLYNPCSVEYSLPFAHILYSLLARRYLSCCSFTSFHFSLTDCESILCCL